MAIFPALNRSNWPCQSTLPTGGVSLALCRSIRNCMASSASERPLPLQFWFRMSAPALWMYGNQSQNAKSETFVRRETPYVSPFVVALAAANISAYDFCQEFATPAALRRSRLRKMLYTAPRTGTPQTPFDDFARSQANGAIASCSDFQAGSFTRGVMSCRRPRWA